MNARLNVHNVRPCAAVPMRARVARVFVPRAAGGSKEGASASGYSVAGMYVVRRPSPVVRHPSHAAPDDYFWWLLTPTSTRFSPHDRRPTSPKAWSMIAEELKRNKLKFVKPSETSKRGTLVIDIRPSQDYEASHIPGAYNCEFFKSIEGWDPVKILRRAVFAFFGILNGTEYNPGFVDEVVSLTGGKKNADIVLYCNIGGQLEPWGNSKDGRQSRSLTAAFELYNAGFKKVRVLDGGIGGYVKGGFELEA